MLRVLDKCYEQWYAAIQNNRKPLYWNMSDSAWQRLIHETNTVDKPINIVTSYCKLFDLPVFLHFSSNSEDVKLWVDGVNL